mmetsp:Transcript_12343/g.39077  ORF Transcript_12343/g.39077 Transcript_12343/m.39077 type:complete len:531 (-) Transcript_12343:48-1640(-)
MRWFLLLAVLLCAWAYVVAPFSLSVSLSVVIDEFVVAPLFSSSDSTIASVVDTVPALVHLATPWLTVPPYEVTPSTQPHKCALPTIASAHRTSLATLSASFFHSSHSHESVGLLLHLLRILAPGACRPPPATAHQLDQHSATTTAPRPSAPSSSFLVDWLVAALGYTTDPRLCSPGHWAVHAAEEERAVRWNPRSDEEEDELHRFFDLPNFFVPGNERRVQSAGWKRRVDLDTVAHAALVGALDTRDHGHVHVQLFLPTDPTAMHDHHAEAYAAPVAPRALIVQVPGALGLHLHVPHDTAPAADWLVHEMEDREALRDVALLRVLFRTVPEVPFPVPVNDVLDALRWVRSVADVYRFPLHRIILLGEGAGGTLAAAAAVEALRERGYAALPAFNVLACPMLDYNESDTSMQQAAGHALLRRSDLAAMFRDYLLGNLNVTDERAFPARAPVDRLRHLPDTLVAICTADPSADSGRRYLDLLRAADVPTIDAYFRNARPGGFLAPRYRQSYMKMIEFGMRRIETREAAKGGR